MGSPSETLTNARTARSDGNVDEAISLLRSHILANSDDADALLELSALLRSCNRHGEALKFAERANSVRPNDPTIINDLAGAVWESGNWERSEAFYRQACQIAPAMLGPVANLAKLLTEQGRFEEAGAFFEKAKEIDGDNPLLRVSYSHFLFATGALDHAWTEYGVAWTALDGARKPLRTIRPWWEGEDISDKTLMIFREQGIGDEICFASMLSAAARRAKHTMVEVSPRLVDLFTRSFPALDVRAQTIDRDGQETLPHPDFDLMIPMGNLGSIFMAESIDPPGQYLSADPERTNDLKQWMSKVAIGSPAVGISWRSRLNYGDRRNFYCKLEQLSPVLALPNIAWVNLQYDNADGELSEVEQAIGITIHRPPVDLMIDIDGVAALISNLDAIVAPENSVKELAGALDRPVFSFSRSHVSWHFGTDHDPWHRSVRIFPRPATEPWNPTISALAKELARFLAP